MSLFFILHFYYNLVYKLKRFRHNVTIHRFKVLHLLHSHLFLLLCLFKWRWHFFDDLCVSHSTTRTVKIFRTKRKKQKLTERKIVPKVIQREKLFKREKNISIRFFNKDLFRTRAGKQHRVRKNKKKIRREIKIQQENRKKKIF